MREWLRRKPAREGITARLEALRRLIARYVIYGRPGIDKKTAAQLLGDYQIELCQGQAPDASTGTGTGVDHEVEERLKALGYLD